MKKYTKNIDKILKKLQGVKLLVLDIDGVLTGSDIHVLDNGYMKSFNALDGMGIKLLQRGGLELALISLSKSTAIIKKRADDLEIKHYITGKEDKRTELIKILEIMQLSPEQCVYIGDDVIDLQAMKYAKVGISVPNAHPFVRKQADYITVNAGGSGAVREICDLLLMANDLFDATYNKYL